jgi:hypothetical protein
VVHAPGLDPLDGQPLHPKPGEALPPIKRDLIYTSCICPQFQAPKL